MAKLQFGPEGSLMMFLARKEALLKARSGERAPDYAHTVDMILASYPQGEYLGEEAREYTCAEAEGSCACCDACGLCLGKFATDSCPYTGGHHVAYDFTRRT